VTTNDAPIELKPGGNTGFQVTPESTQSVTIVGSYVDDDTGNTVNYTNIFTGTAHNVIAGYSGNFVAPSVVGATIAGGGRLDASYSDSETNEPYPTLFNQVLNHFGSVGGGAGNTANGYFTTVGGGEANSAIGHWATLGGGAYNVIHDPEVDLAALNFVSTIAGGSENRIIDAVGGTIGGGSFNTITNDTPIDPTNIPYPATIAGGYDNTASNAPGGVIGGGMQNTVGAEAATVPGGRNNQASGVGSFAAGVNAKALDDHSFVWGGSTNVETVSSGPSSFVVRSTNVSRFLTTEATGETNDPYVGVTLTNGATSWSSLSDSNSKTAVTPIDHRETLRKVAALPVTAWNYKHDPNRRYIGPMAQDFHEAFGLGSDDKHISTLDTDGVTLSAIKGLVEELHEQDTALAERDARLEALEKQVQALRQQADL
jgi:hypothetical protein